RVRTCVRPRGGRSMLDHDSGDGTVTEVTARSGSNAPGWSTSAVWFDYNNDGKLDLFVVQFVDYSRLRTCSLANSHGWKVEGVTDTQSYYCIPRIFNPMPSHLYRNDGGGHFTD